MITAGLLLLTIGIADLARQFLGRGSRSARIGASVAVVLLVAVLGTAIVAWPLAVAFAVIALAWLALMPSTKDAAVASFWPVVGLAAAVVAFVVGSPATAEGWMAMDAAGSVAFGKAVLALGVACFLLESANIVVRVALQSERSDAAVVVATAPAVRRGLIGRLRRPAPPEPTVPTKQLRGGRLIGPLERLFVVGLIFTSAVALLAAFIAAKGIVRFPEIQKDNAGGTQAEYFLVGSMASWAIALAAAGLLWAVGATPADLRIS
ncbi:hypothetical protein DEU34_1153 [Microbacterium sp. AG1240]|uniref:hypothetical protein n=1 Tax=Microbacterium sp. AG1240 TaxID=2183992 RepID=UPI000EACE7A9|nr:hypothetical protein [Microbacterium sp. AG1240]RKT36635.1 hypothetical protein DEU34_1153 [Microbacterium sp. AG1240]